jgi:hypothetical protein
MEEVVYRFKKDNPSYYEERKARLIEITKQRYRDDPEFKEKMKQTSKNYYNNLKEQIRILNTKIEKMT